MAPQCGQDCVYVLHRVVTVRRDAEVVVALGRNDALLAERGDECVRVSRLDTDECASTFWCARGDHFRLELVEAVEQIGIEALYVLTRLRDPDLLHQLDPGNAGIDGR